MGHIATLALLGLLGVVPVVGQQAQPAMTDSQTLQAILVEMRGLHNDVRLSQTTQILLTELEVQQTSVNRAMQKRDDMRNRLSQTQANEKNMTQQLARYDDPSNNPVDPQQKKQVAQMIENFRIKPASYQEPDTGQHKRPAGRGECAAQGAGLTSRDPGAAQRGGEEDAAGGAVKEVRGSEE